MAIKTLKTRVLPIPREDGNHSRGPVKILLDDSDPVVFCIAVPKWLSAPLNLRTLRGDYITGSSLEAAVGAYEKALTDYTTWVRAQVAKPVILLYAHYKAYGTGERRAVRRNDFGLNHGSPAIAMRIERALDINGNIHDIDSGGRPGSRKHIDREAVVLPYTPEMETSLEAIRASLTDAIYRLDAMLEGSPDEVGAKLLAGGKLLLAAS